MSETPVPAAVIERTMVALKPLGLRTPVTDKLLSRPPFRYLHDLVSEIIEKTSFGRGLYTAEELDSSAIKEKDAKMQWLTKILKLTELASGAQISAKPSKIVAGLDVENTNIWIQTLAQNVSRNTSELVASCGGTKPVSSNVAQAETPKQEPVKKPSNPSPASPPSTSTKAHSKIASASTGSKKPLAAAGTSAARSPAAGTDLKSKKEKTTVKSTTALKKSSTGTSSTAPAKPSKQPSSLASKNKEKSGSNLSVAPSECDEERSINEIHEPPTASVSIEAISSQEQILKTTETVPKGDETASRRSSVKFSKEVLAQTQDLHSQPSLNENLSSITSSKQVMDRFPNDINNNTPANEQASQVGHKVHTENNTGDGAQKIKELSVVTDSKKNADVREPEKHIGTTVAPTPKKISNDECEDLSENELSEPLSARSSGPATRARPVTARKAPPKAKNQSPSAFLSPNAKVKIITGNNDDTINEMEQENNDFEIEMARRVAALTNEQKLESVKPNEVSSIQDDQHGGLVRKLMQSKREMISMSKDSMNAGEKDPQANNINGANQITAIKEHIQMFTRCAHPLGGLLDFLQEDLDNMSKLLDSVRSDYNLISANLEKEAAITNERCIKLMKENERIEQAIMLENTQIIEVKARILSNEAKIMGLVSNLID